jgi:hypothetical protein
MDPGAAQELLAGREWLQAMIDVTSIKIFGLPVSNLFLCCILTVQTASTP